MKYMTISETAEKWSVSNRMVCNWCNNNRIEGAIHSGKKWMIPADAEKPVSMRGRSSKDIYKDHIHLVGDATYCERQENKASESDRRICEINNQLLQGDIEGASENLQLFMSTCERDYKITALALEYTLVYYRGGPNNLKKIKTMIKENVGVYSLVRSGKYPYSEAFIMNYLGLPFNPLSRTKIPDTVRIQILLRKDEHNLFKTIKNKNEGAAFSFEMHCQMAEELQMDEMTAYYHSLLACYYHWLGHIENRDYHTEKALEIILPRKWYMILAEYDYFLDWNLKEYLDEENYIQVRSACDSLVEKYITPATAMFMRNTEATPSVNMIRVGLRLALKMTNAEISEEIGISLYEVKKLVNELYSLTGCDSRDEIAARILKGLAER